MNDNEYVKHIGGSGDPIGVHLRLPLSYQALYLADQTAFHDYAFAVLDDDEAAEESVHTAMLRVQDNWDELLVERNMQQQVWAIMRQTVEEFRQDREDRAAITQGLDDYRRGLHRLNSEQGVFEALAALPPSSSTLSSCATSCATSPSASAGTWASVSRQSLITAARANSASNRPCPRCSRRTARPAPGDRSETDTKD